MPGMPGMMGVAVSIHLSFQSRFKVHDGGGGGLSLQAQTLVTLCTVRLGRHCTA